MPTFQNQRRGSPSVIANPAMASRIGVNASGGVGRGAGHALKASGGLGFLSFRGARNGVLAAQTLDSAGAAIASCTVELFASHTDVFYDRTTSDGSGNFSFALPPGSGPYYLSAIDPTGLLVGRTTEAIYAT